MSSKCSDVGYVKGRREGPARESLASSRGEGRKPDSWRGGGRGILREGVEGGMAGCLFPASTSVLSLCSGLAWEKADRKEAEAGVAYWRLPRKKPRRWRVRWVSGYPGRGYWPNGQLNLYP